MDGFKIYSKLQPIQHWDATCVGWPCRYADGDTNNLKDYFSRRIDTKMKRSIEIACTSKTTFTRQNSSNKKQFQIKQ